MHRHRKLADIGGGGASVLPTIGGAPTREKGYELGFNVGPRVVAPGSPKTFSRTEAINTMPFCGNSN